MRTTLQIDDDVYRAARSLAASEEKSLGEVISELARKGLRPDVSRIRSGGDFPTVDVAKDAPVVTPEMIRAALEDEL